MQDWPPEQNKATLSLSPFLACPCSPHSAPWQQGWHHCVWQDSGPAVQEQDGCDNPPTNQQETGPAFRGQDFHSHMEKRQMCACYTCGRRTASGTTQVPPGTVTWWKQKTYCRAHALWQCGITGKHTAALKTWDNTKGFSVIFALTVVKLSARNNMRIGQTLFIWPGRVSLDSSVGNYPVIHKPTNPLNTLLGQSFSEESRVRRANSLPWFRFQPLTLWTPWATAVGL